MREWLSGRASPCQGEGREFESRFALCKPDVTTSGFLLSKFIPTPPKPTRSQLFHCFVGGKP